MMAMNRPSKQSKKDKKKVIVQCQNEGGSTYGAYCKSVYRTKTHPYRFKKDVLTIDDFR